METEGRISVTITKRIANFKCKLPIDWVTKMKINERNPVANIRYEDDSIVISIAKSTQLRTLSQDEKILQIKKYEHLYSKNYKLKKDIISDIAEYFNINERTVYRYSKAEIPPSILKNVKLIDKQEDDKYNKNTKVMFITNCSSTTSAITIPNELAIRFLEGKTYEELNIKIVYDLYKKNFSKKVKLIFNENNKEIVIINKKRT